MRKKRQADGFDHTDGIDCKVVLDITSKVAIPVAEIATEEGDIIEEQLQEPESPIYPILKQALSGLNWHGSAPDFQPQKYTARSDKDIFSIIALFKSLENFASNESILGLIG